MTKKDYIAIAAALSNGALINCTTKGELAVNTATRRKIAQELAGTFALGNPRFDAARFLAACGVQSA